jgi:hypothetical protein
MSFYLLSAHHADNYLVGVNLKEYYHKISPRDNANAFGKLP